MTGFDPKIDSGGKGSLDLGLTVSLEFDPTLKQPNLVSCPHLVTLWFKAMADEGSITRVKGQV